jgi:hypothetical protein
MSLQSLLRGRRKMPRCKFAIIVEFEGENQTDLESLSFQLERVVEFYEPSSSFVFTSVVQNEEVGE